MLKVAFGALLMVMFAGPGLVSGQTTSCRPTDGSGTSLRSYGVKLATSMVPRHVSTRDTYGIDPVPEHEVELVQNEEVCSDAAAAFTTAVGSGSGQVYVLRVGARYIVEDPTAKIGDKVVAIVFASDDFQTILARFIS